MQKIFFFFLGLLISFTAHASPFGFNISSLIIAKDPADLHGYRAAITYQPPALIWRCLQIYFDAGYGHWWINNNIPNHSLSIYSVAPYVRYYFSKNCFFSPFIEASIGLSYLSKIRIDTRKLGIHFSFQDQLTLGAAFGSQQQFYASLSTLHYSNGSMSGYNAGITVPMMLNIGYRF